MRKFKNSRKNNSKISVKGLISMEFNSNYIKMMILANSLTIKLLESYQIEFKFERMSQWNTFLTSEEIKFCLLPYNQKLCSNVKLYTQRMQNKLSYLHLSWSGLNLYHSLSSIS